MRSLQNIHDSLYGNLHSSTNNYPSKNNVIIDSGATGNYLGFISPQENITIKNETVRITQPNGEKIKSNVTRKLSILKAIPTKASEVDVFKEITFPFISVAKLCDKICTVFFHKHKATIIHNNEIIAEPKRDIISKLWTLCLRKLNECNKNHNKN